jgi:hypothetical protein
MSVSPNGFIGSTPEGSTNLKERQLPSVKRQLTS